MSSPAQSALPLPSADVSKKVIQSIEQYFVPPTNLGIMQWGQTFMVAISLVVMMGAILYIYVSINFAQFQDRISVISSAYLFGSTPQSTFNQFVKNAQAESLATVMNDIQSTTDRASIANTRLNDQASVLARQVAVDVPNSTAQTNNLGISIQKNIAQISDTLSKMGGAVLLNNYMTNGAVRTTQSPAPAQAT